MVVHTMAQEFFASTCHKTDDHKHRQLSIIESITLSSCIHTIKSSFEGISSRNASHQIINDCAHVACCSARQDVGLQRRERADRRAQCAHQRAMFVYVCMCVCVCK